ncbi:hypothetical protein BH11PLA2_BH11PLA2_49290 [soil metagenome]
MRCLATFVLLFGIASLASAKDWTAFESKVGQFTVQAPGKLKTSETTIATDAGDLKVVTESVSESTRLLLSITYVDYPPRFSLVDKNVLLTGVRDGLKTKDARLVRDTIGDDGREVFIHHGKYSTRTRLILSGTRLYQVTATGTPDTADGKQATQFLNSFQITK